MLCYECLKSGTTREAAALCHHCSAVLCTDHAFVIDDPVTITRLLSPTVVLSRKARLLLCGTCKAPLLQAVANNGMCSDVGR